MHSPTVVEQDFIALIQKIGECRVSLEKNLPIRLLLDWLRERCNAERALFYRYEGAALVRCVSANVDSAWSDYCQTAPSAFDPFILALRETPGFIDWDAACGRFPPSTAHLEMVDACQLSSALAYGCINSNGRLPPTLSVLAVCAPKRAFSEEDRYHLSSLAMMLHLVGQEPPTSHVRLNDKERDILTWASAGKTGWETAKILELSPSTVNFYFKGIYRKLGVNNRTQAVSEALSQGLL